MLQSFVKDRPPPPSHSGGAAHEEELSSEVNNNRFVHVLNSHGHAYISKSEVNKYEERLLESHTGWRTDR